MDSFVKPLNLDEDDEPTAGLSPEVVARLAYQIRESDPYPIEETIVRNILMLGRSGSGKTTQINVIKDIATQPGKATLFSDTFDAKFASFSLTDTRGGGKYTINIIDTPGVQEVKRIGEDTRSDEAIMGTVKFCLKNEITKVNCLFIFVSFGGRISAGDKAAFQVYLDMFKNQTVQIGFCVTRCEGMKPAEEESIKKDLMQDEFFKGVLQAPNVSVFFCGLVNSILLKTCTADSLTASYRDIHRRREKLLRFIFAATEQTPLYDFPIVSDGVSSIKNHLDKIEKFFCLLDQTQDWNQESIKNGIEEFTQEILFLKQNEALLSSHHELSEGFTKMKFRVKSFQPNVPTDVWQSLSKELLL